MVSVSLSLSVCNCSVKRTLFFTLLKHLWWDVGGGQFQNRSQVNPGQSRYHCTYSCSGMRVGADLVSCTHPLVWWKDPGVFPFFYSLFGGNSWANNSMAKILASLGGKITIIPIEVAIVLSIVLPIQSFWGNEVRILRKVSMSHFEVSCTSVISQGIIRFNLKLANHNSCCKSGGSGLHP